MVEILRYKIEEYEKKVFDSCSLPIGTIRLLENERSRKIKLTRWNRDYSAKKETKNYLYIYGRLTRTSFILMGSYSSECYLGEEKEEEEENKKQKEIRIKTVLLMV